MKLDKKTLMPTIVLVSICVLVAALLGAVNMLTAPEIEKNALKKEQEALFAVFTDEEDGFDKLENLENLPETVTAVYKARGGKGYAVALSTTSSYSTAPMTFVLGVDVDGKVVGVKLTGYYETKDFGNKYPDSFIGKTEADYADVETVSGVTYSSSAFRAAVGDAITATKIANGEKVEKPGFVIPEAAKSEAEILTLAAELITDSKGFTSVELGDERKNLISLYRENSGKGYAAYVVVISSHYGTVESEALIHIGNDGKIKNINVLTWKTSDKVEGEWPFTPPEESEVDAFYARLEGASSATIDGVEHISGATNTSGGVKNSFKEALLFADEAIKKDLPTSEESLLLYAKEMLGGTPDFENITPDGTTYLRRLYKDKNGNGYAAYVVVISSHYGTVESEALIHIGNNGKINNINVLTWKTSDKVEGEWPFTPPEESEVDAFYARLEGASSATIDGVEHIGGATNTSGGVKKSFKEALLFADEAIKKDLPTSEESLLLYAKEMLGGTPDFENITPKGCEYLRRLYKDKNGNGYAAYVVVISSHYGTVESEALLYIGNDRTIKNIKVLTWKTSDKVEGEWLFTPPEESVVDAFYARLEGASSATIDGVAHISGATNTSGGVKKSFKEALLAVDKYAKKMMLATDEGFIELAKEMLGASSDFEKVTPENATFLKRLYKDKNGAGYVAHVLVMNERYGTVESEAVLHITNDAKIKNIDRIEWKTSEAAYGYVPPSVEEVNEFYKRLVGITVSDVEGVELVSNATNTSTGVVNSFKEALDAVWELERNYAPRIIGIVAIVIMIGAFTALLIYNRKRRAPYEK